MRCRLQTDTQVQTYLNKKESLYKKVLLFKVIRFSYRKLKISITSEQIKFSIFGKLYIGPGLILSHFSTFSLGLNLYKTEPLYARGASASNTIFIMSIELKIVTNLKEDIIPVHKRI